jgi:hypothetical protein
MLAHSMKLLSSFHLTTHRFSLVLKDDARLPPFKGSTYRGVLGHSLKRAVCNRTAGSCEECPDRYQCDYLAVFKPNLGLRGQSIPPPYVVDPAPDRRTSVHKGDELSFDLTLFGTAASRFPIIKRGLCESASNLGLGASAVPFLVGKIERVSRYPDSATQASHDPKGIRFLTPLKLKSNGKTKAQFTGADLLQALVRRAKGLWHFHQEGDFTVAEDGLHLVLRSQTLRWVTLERFSINQPEKVNIGGLVGSAEIAEASEAALELLRLGEYIHVGKNTVYGCGKFRLMRN